MGGTTVVSSDHSTGFPQLDAWLKDVHEMKAAGTYDARKTDSNRFAEWCEREDVDPAEAEGADVHSHLREMKGEYAPNTCAGAFDSLSVFYSFLSSPKAPAELRRDNDPTAELNRAEYEAEHNEQDPDADPEREDELKFVTTAEVETLADHVPVPSLKNELMIRLMFQTGVRQSELVKIQVDKIDREDRTIRLYSPKTDDWRTVFYQDSLDVLLDHWLDHERQAVATAEESPYLFPGPRNKSHRPRYVNGIVTQAAENAGIQECKGEDAVGRQLSKITSHSLRHGHARRAVRSGVPLPGIKATMGHADISTTQKYLIFATEDHREAYENW